MSTNKKIHLDIKWMEAKTYQGRIQKFWKGGAQNCRDPNYCIPALTPFLNLLEVPPFESLCSIQEHNLALDHMEILTEWRSIYCFG